MTDSNDNLKTARRTKPPLPVDRGWAWLIMIAAYIMLMLIVSFPRSLSIFLPLILDHYKQPATVTTLAFGISDLTWSLTNIAIPTILLPRFSVRTLCLIGAVLQSLGVITLAYSPNITVFNCVFGVTGCAAGLMIVPSLIHLGYFFKKRLSFANSFTHAGGSTATVFVPFLTQFLQESYGFQGALLILGGISLNSVAVAMLLRPLSMYDDTESTMALSLTNDEINSQDFSHLQMQTFVDEQNKDDANEESKFLEPRDTYNRQLRGIGPTFNLEMAGKPGVVNSKMQHVTADDMDKTVLIPISDSDRTKSDIPKSVDKDVQQLLFLLSNGASVNEVNDQNSIKTLNIRNSAHFTEHSNISNSKASLKNEGEITKHDPTRPSTYDRLHSNKALLSQEPEDLIYNHYISPEISLNSSQREQMLPLPAHGSGKESGLPQEHDHEVSAGRCCSIQKIKAYLSSSVLLNPVAVMLVLAGGLSTPGGNMYLPVLGLENGVLPEQVPWMLTIMGVADIVGKIGIGYFADLGYIRPIHIVCITQLTVGVTCQFAMFYQGFGPMVAMSIVYGMTAGIIQALLSPMIIEMVGLQYLAQVISIFYLACGIFTFILNVAVGAIWDATGSFAGGFNFIGGMLLISLTLLVLEPVFIKCRDRPGSKFRKSKEP